MKDHTSHDVVLLCRRCHQISNLHDTHLREKLAHECGAPFATKNTNQTVEIPRLRYKYYNFVSYIRKIT